MKPISETFRSDFSIWQVKLSTKLGTRLTATAVEPQGQYLGTNFHRLWLRLFFRATFKRA